MWRRSCKWTSGSPAASRTLPKALRGWRNTVYGRRYATAAAMAERVTALDREFSDRRFTAEARSEWNALNTEVEEAEDRARRKRVATLARRAERFAAAWTLAADAGLPAPEPRPVTAAPVAADVLTVEAAAREFTSGIRSGAIRNRRGRAYKPAAVRAYERRLRLHVLPTLGCLPVVALTRADVVRLAERVTADASADAARAALATLSLVLGRAVNLGTVPASVAAGVRAPAGDRRPPRFLDPAEADRLQAAADALPRPSIGAFLATALATGLRFGELMGALTWGPGGLDLDACTLTVSATLDPSGVLVSPKNGKPRTVPLGAALVARLRRYRLASDRSLDGERVQLIGVSSHRCERGTCGRWGGSARGPRRCSRRQVDEPA